MDSTEEPTMTATTIDPVATDTKIAELSDIINGAYDRIARHAEYARRLMGERKVRIGRSMGWLSTDTDALDKLAATTFSLTMDANNAAGILDAVAALRETIREALEQRAPLDALYDTHRWTRFSEVAGGHIHKGRHCDGGTLRPTTRVGWRVDLSGRSIADAVAELGPLLCSRCFPDAPVEWQRNAADVKAEAEAAEGIYCTSTDLAPGQAKGINWRRRSNYVSCHVCHHPAVSVTSTGRKRKHRRPVK